MKKTAASPSEKRASQSELNMGLNPINKLLEAHVDP